MMRESHYRYESIYNRVLIFGDRTMMFLSTFYVLIMFYNYIKCRSNISIAIIKNKISGHREITYKLEEQSLDPQQNMITRCGAHIYHPVHGQGQRDRRITASHWSASSQDW